MLDARDRLAGYDDIGLALGCAPFQVRRYAALRRSPVPLEKTYRDPLRLDYLHGHPILYEGCLEAWRRRNQGGGAGERKIYGWHSICARVELRRSAAMTACALQKDPLPVVRPAVGRVWAYESALDEWRDARRFSYAVHHLLRSRRLPRKRLLGSKVAAPGPAASSTGKAKSAKRLRGESRATGTTRVGVAREPREYRSQVESAASSTRRNQPQDWKFAQRCRPRRATMGAEL